MVDGNCVECGGSVNARIASCGAREKPVQRPDFFSLSSTVFAAKSFGSSFNAFS